MLQMLVGLTITALAIWLVPVVEDLTNRWRWAFMILVPAPIAGIIALMKLRASPETG